LFGDWAFLEGEGGNDIISVDGPLIQTAATGGSTTINGGAGFNIVYVKTISNTSNNRSVSIDVTTTGGSLLVLGGDYSTSKASTITGAGADNVLLIKSGAANTGFTFTGFARTLTY
jgi:beta-lactamase superfamily II metal-dependent hydrolase